MNLYDLHQSPERLHRHADADMIVPEIFWPKYVDNLDELKKRELAIATSSTYSYLYVSQILHHQWPLGEAAIARNPDYSFFYASQVMRSSWPAAEPTIAASPFHSYLYASCNQRAVATWRKSNSYRCQIQFSLCLAGS